MANARQFPEERSDDHRKVNHRCSEYACCAYALPSPFPPFTPSSALLRLLFFRSVFPPLIRLTDANTRCICNTSLSSHDPRKVSGNKALEAENTLQRYFLHASRKLIFATCRSSITWQAFSNNSKVTWIGFRSPRFTICCLVWKNHSRFVKW